MHTILILASTTRRGRTRPTTGTDPQVRLVPQGVHRATIPRRVRPVPATITGAATDTDDEPSFIWKRSQIAKSQKYTYISLEGLFKCSSCSNSDRKETFLSETRN